MKELLTALLLVKTEIKPVFRDSKNNHRNYKYVSLDCILDKVTPVLSKHNLLIVQYVDDNNLVTELCHCETAQKITARFPLTPNPDPQKTGAMITYYRRYQITSMLGLIGTDEDTDCHEYTNTKVETTKPVETTKAVNYHYKAVTDYCKAFGVKRETLSMVLKQLNIKYTEVDGNNKNLILDTIKELELAPA